MKRQMIKIDEEKCNGCGNCVPNCHEGALQIIDGKARLISDLLCDGLGACIGHCPEGAMILEEREAEPYDEVKVMEDMIPKGRNTILAHLKHLKEHNELEYLRQGVEHLRKNATKCSFDPEEIIQIVHNNTKNNNMLSNKKEPIHAHFGGCPGSREMTIDREDPAGKKVDGTSQLRQWPVQMHLVNPQASYFIQSDLLLAADCVAFAMGNFHQDFLKGKSLAIACPKLDANKEIYVEKLKALVEVAKVNTITIMMMEVPCCGGLLQMAKMAVESANRKVPVKTITVGINGTILSEEWV